MSHDAGSKHLTPPSPRPSVHLVKTCLLSTTPAQLSASMKPTNRLSFGSLPSSRCRPNKQITSKSITRAATKTREEEGKEGGLEQVAEGWRIRCHVSVGPKEERRCHADIRGRSIRAARTAWVDTLRSVSIGEAGVARASEQGRVTEDGGDVGLWGGVETQGLVGHHQDLDFAPR